ncbi:hypothetical protein CTAYLR_001795 [Chrysophaeum taylorii]|uniref:Plastid lipid-associated protein/fibrillin conserved domain-containing protein n=1 Tax=Chrysophaeum taylorii TaxID=2483200 RepID=A0AAD7UGM5_9STRA|nr:hypothetical protein CTAYLR_001795 [Chrysophaeum taylorii]
MVIGLMWPVLVSPFSVAPRWQSAKSRRSAVPIATAIAPAAAKTELLAAIDTFRAIKTRDGGVAVDFGVRGGELDKESRTPNNLVAARKYYEVSEAAGKAADDVVAAVHNLEASTSPIEPTRFFGTVEGAACGLHGGWAQLFTTAADATFDAKSKRGDAEVCNVVDARKGEITNVIQFKAPNRTVDQLRVRLTAKPTSANKVELVFRTVRVRFAKRFLGIFKQILLPVPALAISRLFFLFRPNKRPKQPFFEVLYLDDDLRVQRTGDGNLFVQRRIDPAIAGF